jgi:hypothetical protein
VPGGLFDHVISEPRGIKGNRVHGAGFCRMHGPGKLTAVENEDSNSSSETPKTRDHQTRYHRQISGIQEPPLFPIV